MFKKRITWR